MQFALNYLPNPFLDASYLAPKRTRRTRARKAKRRTSKGKRA